MSWHVRIIARVDWARLFNFDTPPLEIVVRGTVIYVTIYTLLRVVLKREAGTNGITDLIVVVLIADAAQNAMAGSYKSISDGMLLVAVIIGWSFLLNWLAHRFEWAARILRPGPLLLIRNGELLHQNMRKEMISEAQLREQARKHGIGDLAVVREGRMESDGQFSFLVGSRATDGGRRPSQHQQHPGVAERVRLDVAQVQEFGHPDVVGAAHLGEDLRADRGAVDLGEAVPGEERGLERQHEQSL